MNGPLKKIQESVYKEQWTRAALNTFSVNGFEEINVHFEKLSKEEKLESLEFCETQLQNNKNSVYSLYIAGLVNLEENTIHDEYILRLMDIFTDNHKWNVVEYLSKMLLTFKNNLNALHKLVEVYEATDNKEKLIETWNSIVQADFEEADILLKLAKHKESIGEHEESIKDLKKAINRYLYQKNFTPIREIWSMLVSKNPLDTDFYFNFITKMERVLISERSEELYVLLLNSLLDDAKNMKIHILKRLLKLYPENQGYREQLVNMYRIKYHDNPKIEDFIRMSNLSQEWRNIQEAINDFEKHISFFPGSFVYHNKWGIGLIAETAHQYIIIDFARKRKHKMDISMAVTSLEILPKKHFWIIRSVVAKDKLKEQILKNPTWTLKKIISSLGTANMKIIKSELVPSILSNSEWNSWSVKARKILSSNPCFGVVANKADHYSYSETPVSMIEKFYELFKTEEQFIGKMKLFRKAALSNLFADVTENFDFFWIVFEYFNSFLKNKNNKIDKDYVCVLFLFQEIVEYVPSIESQIYTTPSKVIPEISLDTLKEIVKAIKINDYKNLLFKDIRKYRTDWKELYVQLAPYYHTQKLLLILEKDNEIELLQKMFGFIQKNFGDYRQAFIWFVVNLHDRPWLKDITDDFKIISDMLRTYILLYRDIQNKCNILLNKKLMSTAEEYLFKTENIPRILEISTEQNIKYLYSLVSKLSDVLPNRVLQVRESITSRLHDFDFNDRFDFEQSSSTGFLTLEESYKQKQKELQHLHDIEVPENSKEIEIARSFGDLKENAEYRAAIEHQERLNTKAGRLKKELEQARIFDRSNMITSQVTFSTKVVLQYLEKNSKKEFTVLGPWESNPENGIISYLSPLGQKIYKKKLQERCEFSINDVVHKVKIVDIQEV